MTKKFTGNIITRNEYRQKKNCFNCGILCSSNKCEECSLKEFNYCRYCGYCLRTNEKRFYSYSIHHDHIKEFLTIEQPRYTFTEDICDVCREKENEIKENKCGYNGCKNKLIEGDDGYALDVHYQRFGKICRKCLNKYTIENFQAKLL